MGEMKMDANPKERTTKKSDLPFGSEFSPSQIELAEVLKLADQHAGDWRAFENAVFEKYFKSYKDSTEYNQRKLANNTKLGMIAYGIITKDCVLTELGTELLEIADEEIKLFELLARHILLNLHGMTLIQCINDMIASGENVNLTTLREALEERGIYFPRGGKHPSIMRLWLEKAGVFVAGQWKSDPYRIEEILGVAPETFPELANFTEQQRAFLRALANTGETEPQPANQIVELATATYGVKFPEKSLPKMVLNALEDAGYITVTKTTTGRGAKPFLVAPTDKLIADIVEPFLEQLKTQTDPKLINLLRTPLSNILAEMSSKDRYVAGLALEALAFKIMRLIDLSYVATRLRANQTGGAEVDLVFESTRLIFSRWQVQCKNTSRVALDDVAKEVGLTHFLKSNAIIIVTTGEVGNEARRYANKVMGDSNLAIVMVDKTDLETMTNSPSAIVRVFEREAKHAMALKKLDL